LTLALSPAHLLGSVIRSCRRSTYRDRQQGSNAGIASHAQIRGIRPVVEQTGCGDGGYRGACGYMDVWVLLWPPSHCRITRRCRSRGRRWRGYSYHRIVPLVKQMRSTLSTSKSQAMLPSHPRAPKRHAMSPKTSPRVITNPTSSISLVLYQCIPCLCPNALAEHFADSGPFHPIPSHLPHTVANTYSCAVRFLPWSTEDAAEAPSSSSPPSPRRILRSTRSSIRVDRLIGFDLHRLVTATIDEDPAAALVSRHAVARGAEIEDLQGLMSACHRGH